MLVRKEEPIAIGEAPSVCSVGPVIAPRIDVWCNTQIEPINSAKLRDAKNVIVLGTCSEFSVALRCATDEVIAYKTNLARYEQNILNDYLLKSLKEIKTQAEAARITKLLRVLQTRDMVLMDLCVAVEKHLKTQTFPEGQDNPFRDDTKRDLVATIRRLKKEDQDPKKWDPCINATAYTICICPTPTKSDEHWRTSSSSIRVRHGTYPIGAVSQGTFVIVYCDADQSSDEFDLTVSFYQFDKQRLNRIKTMPFRIAAPIKTPVIMRVGLDKERCIIGLGHYVYVLDDKRLTFKFTHDRLVSCVQLIGSLAIVGTTEGEVFRFDTEGTDVFVHTTPKLEPIWQTQWVAEKETMYMMTCMAIFIDSPFQRIQVDHLRPVSIFADKDFCVIYCKYGFVQMQGENELVRYDPVEETDISHLPFYDAIHMTKNQMTIVESHGRVRCWKVPFPG